MFKEPGDEGEVSPGETVDDVLDEQLGEDVDQLDDEGIDALLEVNGVGGSTTSSSSSEHPARPSTPPSSSSNQLLKDAVTPQKRHQEAMMLMMQGKRHMLVKDLNSAVNAYQEACRIMDEIHGPLAPPCGDAYMQYGQALLELARSENQVLAMGGGGGESGDEEDDDDEEEEEGEGERDEEEQEDEEVGEEDLEASAKEEIDGPSTVPKAKDKGKGLAVKKKFPCADTCAQQKSGNEEDDDNEGEENNPEEEDVSTLQLAWEVLEMAKVVFLKSGDSKEKQIKAADCFLTLGEVSLESEAYDAAVDDFNKCLEIQTKHLAEDDRYIAETHYQLGLTHSFAKNYSDARLHFRHAIKTLESRVNNCKGVVESAIKETGSREKALKDEKVYKAKEEIEDLKSLLPEILAKYEDAAEMEAEHSEASKAVKEASENLHRSPAKKQQGSAPGVGTSSGAGPSGLNGVGSSSSFLGAPSSSSSSSSTTLTSGFTAPFPRAEDEVGGSSNGERKITFGSASSASSSAPSGVSMIAVRRNLNKEPSISSSSSLSSSSSSIPAGAVNDISSLVRRKRKPEEESSATATSTSVANGSEDLAANIGATRATNGAAESSGESGLTNRSGPADGAGPALNGEETPEAKRIKINGDA